MKTPYARTLRMIWNETPRGCRILDAEYLSLCDYIDRTVKTSLVRFVKVTGIDLWGCTPREAIRAFDAWKRKLDEHEFAEFVKQEKNFWENCGVLHPPHSV